MPAGLSVMWVGVVVMVVGFMAKWTDRTFGLVQVLYPDLFEWIGDQLMRLGFVVAVVGGLVWVAQAL